MSDAVDLDGLRAVLGGADDDAVLDFYAWQDARELADTFLDDGCEGLAELLADYARGRIAPVALVDVAAWLAEFQAPDAMALTRADLVALAAEWQKSRSS